MTSISLIYLIITSFYFSFTHSFSKCRIKQLKCLVIYLQKHLLINIHFYHPEFKQITTSKYRLEIVITHHSTMLLQMSMSHEYPTKICSVVSKMTHRYVVS